jgi:hypothetical protein
MDLWDLTKVLWRRRWVALPMALVSAVIGVYVMSTIRADYQAAGHITLLPPSQQRAVDPKATATPQTVSPWNVYSLADALVIYAGRGDVHEEFAKAGYSQEFTATIGGTQLPIIEVEVVASSPELAKSSLTHLIEQLDQQLHRLQEPYGVQGGEAITAETLDSGQNIQVITSAKKRVLIVVAAIGLILTVATSLAWDAVVRRRTSSGKRLNLFGSAKKRRGTAGGGPEPAGRKVVAAARAAENAETQLIEMPPVRQVHRPEQRVGRAPSGTTFTSGRGSAALESERGSEGKPQAAVRPPGPDGLVIDYRVTRSGEPAPPAQASTQPEDATIVLPLTSLKGWTGKTGNPPGPNGAKPS